MRSEVKVRPKPRGLLDAESLILSYLIILEPLKISLPPIDKEAYIRVFISAFFRTLKMPNDGRVQ